MCIAVGGERAHHWALKRVLMMAARPITMATATKSVMAPNRDITGTGDGKATAATMDGEGDGMKDMAAHTTPGEGG